MNTMFLEGTVARWSRNLQWRDRHILECGASLPWISTCKHTLAGSEISDPTSAVIKEEWNKIVTTASLTGYQKWGTRHEGDSGGSVQISTQCMTFRIGMLQQMEKHMWLNTDDELKAMSLSEMHSLVAKFQQPFPPSPVMGIQAFLNAKI